MRYLTLLIFLLMTTGCEDTQKAAHYDHWHDRRVIELFENLPNGSPELVMEKIDKLEEKVSDTEFLPLLKEEVRQFQLLSETNRLLNDSKLIEAVGISSQLTNEKRGELIKEIVSLNLYLKKRPFTHSSHAYSALKQLELTLPTLKSHKLVAKLIEADQKFAKVLEDKEYVQLSVEMLTTYEKLVLYDKRFAPLAISYPDRKNKLKLHKSAVAAIKLKRSDFSIIKEKDFNNILDRISLKLIKKWQKAVKLFSNEKQLKKGIEALNTVQEKQRLSSHLLRYAYLQSPVLKKYLVETGKFDTSPAAFYLGYLKHKKRKEDEARRLEEERKREEERQKRAKERKKRLEELEKKSKEMDDALDSKPETQENSSNLDKSKTRKPVKKEKPVEKKRKSLFFFNFDDED